MASNYKFSNEEMAAIKQYAETKDKRADAKIESTLNYEQRVWNSVRLAGTGFHAAYVSHLEGNIETADWKQLPESLWR